MRSCISKTFFTLLFLCCLSCTKNEHKQSEPANETYIKTTVQYKSLILTGPDLISLDIYSYSQNNTPKPVIIYVHGGGWCTGDKSNKLANKLSLFNALNYIFISVNYRLSPTPFSTSPGRIKYPDHNNDVADAVKWVFENALAYGGDPSKIALLGHSSGAHLVSLTGASQQFLPVRGLSVNKLKGVASIDTEGYDVPSQIADEIYQNAFGTDMNMLVQASPLYNIVPTGIYPRFFIAKRGTVARINYADAFINKLQSAGVNVSQINGSQYDHEGINNAIGDPDDTVITPALKLFLQQCFQ